MDDKVTDRVKKLIALAMSTHSEEEARTAAHMAVRLIAQHGLIGKPQVRAAPPPPPPVPWDGPIMCKPSWSGFCEVCRAKIRGKVYWQGKRVRHYACHAAKGYK